MLVRVLDKWVLVGLKDRTAPTVLLLLPRLLAKGLAVLWMV